MTDADNCGGRGQSCAAVDGQSAICSGGTCQCVDCGGDAACPVNSLCGGGCICIEASDGLLQCAGVVFIEGGDSCVIDADCPDPQLPTNAPYTVRCSQGGGAPLSSPAGRAHCDIT